jgi:hypothetical protein
VGPWFIFNRNTVRTLPLVPGWRPHARPRRPRSDPPRSGPRPRGPAARRRGPPPPPPARPPAASRLPPPLRLRRRPRPAATALCAGHRRAHKTRQPEHRRRARLPASSASRPRLPPPPAPVGECQAYPRLDGVWSAPRPLPLLPAPAPVRESRASLAARRSPLQRLVPLQRGGQHLDGAVPFWHRPLPARRHGLHSDT